MSRILLIGDDVVQMQVLALLLEPRHGHVRQSANLQEAVRMLQTVPEIGAIIVIMPRSSGDGLVDARAWIRSLREVREAVPILFLSNGKLDGRESQSLDPERTGVASLGLPRPPETILHTVDRLTMKPDMHSETSDRARDRREALSARGRGDGRSRILVVDDDAMVTRVTAELLGALGYEVLTASSGGEAVACCRTWRDSIDLVLLDLMMPGMDGAMCFDRLRDLAPSLEILISTGSGHDDEVVTTLIRRGAVGVVQKPYDIHELSEAVERALTRVRDSRASSCCAKIPVFPDRSIEP